MKALKQLVKKNPEFLQVRQEKKREKEIRHFRFAPIKGIEDTVTMPVCCSVNPGVMKRHLHGVTCTDCLAMLEKLAQCEDYAEALKCVEAVCPKVMKPDPDVMEQRHDKHPTRAARLHMLAAQFFQAHNITEPSELPLRVIGGDERTFYLNMVEAGLINPDGERTGLTAQELAGGADPVAQESIFEVK